MNMQLGLIFNSMVYSQYLDSYSLSESQEIPCLLWKL
jgi:hypothetical protein